MKSICLLLFLVTTSFHFGQTVELVHQFQDDKLFRLYQHPFQENMLMGLTREWYVLNGNQVVYRYSILDIANNQVTQRTWDNLDSITGQPVIFNNYVLFSGHQPSTGNELYIWNGSNLQLIDILPGVLSSDPILFARDSVCYVSALNGPVRQLYRLEANLTLTQLTFEDSLDAQIPIHFDDSISLYLTYDSEADSSILRKQYNGIHTTIETFFGGEISQLKKFNDNYYFTVFGYTDLPTHRVNQFGYLNLQGNYTSLQSYIAYNYVEEPKVFDFGDDLFLISQHADTLNQSPVTTIYKFINESDYVPHTYFNEQFGVMDILDFGNSMQFIVRSTLDLDKIYAFTEQDLIFMDSSNYHLHYVSDKHNKAYYISIKHYQEDMAMLYEIDKNTFLSEQHVICDSSEHPPYFYFDKNGGAWLDSTLYFIEGNYTDMMTANIYKFEATLNVGIPEKSNTAQILAYPTIASEYIHLKGNLEGLTFELIDSQGKIVHRGQASETILLPILDSGMYFLNLKQDASPIQVEKIILSK